MVDNLIDNAVRHNLPGGLINVTCDAVRTRHDWWSKAAVRSWTRRPSRSSPSRSSDSGAERTGSQNGHGLGLSIVAAIAAAHGGELRLYAREQGGLGAEITLPVARDAHAATAPA